MTFQRFKRRLIVLAMLLVSVIALSVSTKAKKACVVVDNTYVEGSCIYSDRTICCDGPESCVVTRHLKIWCIGDPPVGGNDNARSSPR